MQRSTVFEVLRTGGRPLDGATRTEMENRFGADFSDVRGV
ncbi:eCIS core domain-containing protein [Kitasatospora sp. NPDC054795]